MTHFQKTASTMDMDDSALIMDMMRCMERLVGQETIKMNEEITMENTHEYGQTGMSYIKRGIYQ